ncbi:MAG: 5-dehydro-4-deoxy-D-glucuronate isomerase [Aurantimonas endophytica]|uniref:4-deoxy-L-threo-5-hexosulose-uronate ketol-isomerase n=1 Tax=Aurantimonas endophytica TaxID=1522175 RepID=A0A7W6HFY0_9HYPH|nr:5-dehydro-4-deoxy-D-glucuronate isomerase [Aurantimonas endophytica]MBB4004506.1 4-deoxy-L-threo-5-hexosulose-uronate ketol-isomerase [Aurantimonas endophytica]MCO6405342.1 5-dehydro-4-deoxy-D-glucuronate isomerase [Aurantimonas endophytica]
MKIETRQAIDPRHAKTLDTGGLRSEFLMEGLFLPGEISLVYSHYDRLIVGGAVPAGGELVLDSAKETGTPAFLDRREAVVVNVGTAGSVRTGSGTFDLGNRDMLYVGLGDGPLTFSGEGARFYILSAPAHRRFDTRLVTIDAAKRVDLGAAETSNDRSIFQFVHPDVMESCQIVVGMTTLHNGSVWNTMPAHLHDRRSEAYLYFDLPQEARVFHMMGDPAETRHLVVKNEDAVLSPPWSIHCGAGTASYTFIWAMAGDNVDYRDVDMVAMSDLK